MSQPPVTLDVERAVRERYAAAARERESALCCPVRYDPRYLEAIPREVLERDYGCGDPSRWVREGDTVLDLGSGGGKICFIAAQIAGPRGRVIGVDANQEMLDLARRAAPVVAERVGYANVEFLEGPIEDLHPLVADASVDLVVSNCVLNLVRPEAKSRLVGEVFRVLRDGGRVAVSDIVADRPVPEDLRADPELWSGCISGAFAEGELLGELERAGLRGVTLAERAAEPFRVLRGIDFRSVTVTAHKGAAAAADDGSSACCAPKSCC